jgi:hypothetical protein
MDATSIVAGLFFGLLLLILLELEAIRSKL